MKESKANNNNNINLSYPEPPRWYTQFKNDIEFPNPPPLPDKYYTCFGIPQQPISKDIMSLVPTSTLDSDTRMVDFQKNLNVQFKQLFDLLVEQLLLLLDEFSQTSQESNASNIVKKIIKIYKNLSSILGSLRYWEAKEEIILNLENQVKMRKKLIKNLYKSVILNPLEYLISE